MVRLNPGSGKRLIVALAPRYSDILERFLRDDFIHDQDHFSENERYQLGHFTTDEYLLSVRSVIGEHHPETKIRSAILTEIAGDNVETTRLLEPLSRITRLGCFSNTHAMHWEHMNTSFAWMKIFEIKLASHLCGVAKPDAGAFRAICGAANLEPNECLFIDDRLVNVEGARSIGMQALHFQGASALVDDLGSIGIMI